MTADTPSTEPSEAGPRTERVEFHTVDVERLAKARHRWQHPTYALDLTPPTPGVSRRCGCYGWAMTIIEMLDLLRETEASR